MSNYIIRLLLDAVAILAAAYLLPGVEIEGYWAAILVAFSLSILNSIAKPLMVIVTIPVTVFSLGLFLFVINAFMILLADWVVDEFMVDGFWYALLFSLVLTLFKSLLNGLFKDSSKSAKVSDQRGR